MVGSSRGEAQRWTVGDEEEAETNLTAGIVVEVDSRC